MKLIKTTASKHFQLKKKKNEKGPKSQGRVHDTAKNSRIEEMMT